MKSSESIWDKLKEKIYYWDGSWRDIYILNVDVDDWMIWVDYVNQNYSISWYNGKIDTEENQIDFKVIQQYLNGEHDLCSSAKIFIDEIQINCHFFSDSEIENDIDPREINSLKDHNKIIKYMTEISVILEKDVILTPESTPQTVLIKVSGASIYIN